jgi:hypothetical protein
MKYFIVVSLLTGCGVGVHVDPVAPIQVVHTFNINFDAVHSYCAQQCALTGVDDPTFCTNSCYANFLQVLMASMAGPVQ